jgi:hypothetical protein
VVAEAGFLVTAVLVGRAGGLLRVLPAVERAAVVLVGCMNEDAFGGVAFVPVNGLLGGRLAFVAGCGLGGDAGSTAEVASAVEAIVRSLIPCNARHSSDWYRNVRNV